MTINAAIGSMKQPWGKKVRCIRALRKLLHLYKEQRQAKTVPYCFQPG